LAGYLRNSPLNIPPKPELLWAVLSALASRALSMEPAPSLN